jgi:hypothetical protein
MRRRRVPRAAAAVADAEVGRGLASVGGGEGGVGRAQGADHPVVDEGDERCGIALLPALSSLATVVFYLVYTLALGALF